MELIPVRTGKLPISRNTAYTWHGRGTHPKLLFKVCNKLFFDMDEWNKIALAAKKKNIKKFRN